MNAGNDNPWVVGASAAKSSEDLADNVSHPLHGTLDNLRISKKRRVFSAP